MRFDPPFSFAHPASIAAVTRLLGLQTQRLAQASILQINTPHALEMLSLALQVDGLQITATFSDADAMGETQSLLDEVNCTSLTLFYAPDMQSLSQLAGKFDYIIAHRVLSFLPPHEHDLFFDMLAQLLSDKGIAYVDYATYPGFHLHDAKRDLAQFAMRGEAATADDVNIPDYLRHVVEFVGQGTRAVDNTVYGDTMIDYADALSDGEADLTIDLNSNFSPLYFYQFATMVQGAGLRFLHEADFSSRIPEGFTPESLNVVKVISNGDTLREQQYIDFLRNRKLRQSLITHAGVEPVTAVSTKFVASLYFGSNAEAVDVDGVVLPTKFETDDGQGYEADNPIIAAAMFILSKITPDTLDWLELQNAIVRMIGLDGMTVLERDRLAGDLVTLAANNADMLRMYAWRPSMPTEPPDRPHVFVAARTLAAQRVNTVPNLRGEIVEMPTLALILAPRLDGQKDREAVLQVMYTWVEAEVIRINEGNDPMEVLGRQLDALLIWYQQNSLLVGTRA